MNTQQSREEYLWSIFKHTEEFGNGRWNDKLYYRVPEETTKDEIEEFMRDVLEFPNNWKRFGTLVIFWIDPFYLKEDEEESDYDSEWDDDDDEDEDDE